MSKERKFLKKILATGWLNNELSCEIEAILDQPEQEPVAWKVIDGTNGEFMFSRVKPMERTYKYDVVIPLYTAPPTREPLSEATIAKLWMEAYLGTTQMVRNFARAIEKHHGIGVDDETV